MANGFFYNFDNKELRRLHRKLQTLGPKLETRYVKNATSKAMQPVAVEVRRNARKSKRTGWLSKNIGKVTRTYPRKHVTMTMVGPTNKKDPRTGENPANIAHLVEKPVKPHPIELENAKALSNKKQIDLGLETRRFFTERQIVDHPGFRGRPFIEPAFDAKESQAFKIYADELTKAIAKEAIAL